MIKTNSDFPLSKKELKEQFGYLSFQTIFMNLDLVGIRIIRTGEVVCILYRGAWKVGFIYEGGNLTPKQVQYTYNDAPDNYNELDRWWKEREDKVEVLHPQKDNYVFINEKEIVLNQKIKK